MNNREWTDQELSKPREEWGNINIESMIEGKYQEGVHYGKTGIDIRDEQGKIESTPGNKAPGYENSEHWHNKQANTSLGYGMSSREPGYKSSEHWYNENGNIPLGYEMPSREPGYKSSEHMYNEGFVERGGPSINGKTPNELIDSSLLTVESITEEEKQVVYEDIMLGFTRNKDLLAKKIDLIISEERIVNKIISNQYMLAVEEMKNEKRGFVDHSPKNRKFQFLATIKILMEKGYDLDNFKFSKQETQIGLAELLADFRKDCSRYSAKNIDDPSWFKDGIKPEDYDMRKVNNPWLFSGVLIREIYAKNPKKFEEEYENYKATTKMPPEEMLSYEDFMRYGYSIEVSKKTNNLQQFKEEREKQMQQDQVVRKEQLSNLTQEIVETKEGHSLR